MGRVDRFCRDGLTFDVTDVGPDDGDVVVLLHGFPQDRTAYAGVADRLATAGLRVLAPDQRGYSPGARPADTGAYVLRELVDDVVALLDAAGVGRATVVGHDWGGAVAWAFASRRRERAAGLVAVSTPHPAAMRRALLRGTQAVRSSYMVAFAVPGLAERVLVGPDGARLHAALRRGGLGEAHADRYAGRMAEPGAATAALAWYRALPAGRGWGAGRVDVPTTYVHGTRDPFFSPTAVAATGGFVRGTYRSVAVDAGHWLPEMRPDVLADAVLVQRSLSARAR